jgi:creatinine amidohydrolase
MGIMAASEHASIEFSELTSGEADVLVDGDRVPVLLLPVGTVEPHGPHAPLGTDNLLANAICLRTARALAGDPKVRALVLPTVPYGVTRYARGFRGAISVEAPVLAAFLTGVCRSLVADGFTRIAVVNCHFEPDHVSALRQTCEAVTARGVNVWLFDLTRRARASRLGDEFRRGSCHAGQYETSLVLSERPELVDDAVAATLPPLDVNMPEAIADGQSDFIAMGMERAYCGAPADATAAHGEELYGVLVQMLSELVHELADER